MTESASQLAYLRDPRLSVHAIGAAAAWLWTTDASRILWANAVGAAIFDAHGPVQLAGRRFDATDSAALQIARIAPTLSPNGAPRLERLRGFGAGVGRALTCACARITLSDHTTAVLVLAAEAAGPALPLDERVRRLLAEIDAPIAVFSAEGVLLHAAAPALDRLAAAATLTLLGAGGLAADALQGGHASGPSKIGALSIERVGQYPATVLIATFAAEIMASDSDQAQTVSPAEPVADAAPAPETQAKPAPAVSPPDEPGSPEAIASMEAPAESPAPVPVPASDAVLPERRFPLRFVWQMDAGGRFNIDSGDFIRLTGARTAQALGRPWNEIVDLLALDPQGQVAQALATRDTWSGITLDWPVDGTDERLAVELSGLPVFDRDRAFGGYRGFGVSRDARRISLAASLRHPPTRPEDEDVAPAAVAESAPPNKYTPPPTEERPVLTVVPPSKNVVPFRASSPADKTPTLSPVERSAFRELAKQLTTRLQEGDESPASPSPEIDDFEGQPAAGSPISEDAGYGRIAREANAMGFMPPQSAQPLASAQAAKDIPPAKAPRRDDRSILDRLPVGILVYRLDTLLYANRAFLDWTGYDSVGALADDGGLDTLFVEPGAESGGDSADGRPLTISTNRSEQPPAGGRLFTAPWEGETAHVLMLVPPQGNDRGKAGESAQRQAEAETQWKKTEEELINAKRRAEKASSAKSEFLAKISHEIRTPLNAIIGFSEVMMGERFGPIANERYREYLKDIHASGGHLVSLLNDLLDLSKIEAGKLDLTFANINLNELTQQCVAIMQPQANQERIIIRTSLPPVLPPIMADARSVRQIALNLLSNSIKFTGAGGQVIVSTALTDNGEVVLRVRDTGAGMSEKEIKMALEPFRQLATSARGGSGGSGIGLPLTKALAEANRADFSIKSAVNAGTLVEISFPRSRVLAD